MILSHHDTIRGLCSPICKMRVLGPLFLNRVDVVESLGKIPKSRILFCFLLCFQSIEKHLTQGRYSLHTYFWKFTGLDPFQKLHAYGVGPVYVLPSTPGWEPLHSRSPKFPSTWRGQISKWKHKTFEFQINNVRFSVNMDHVIFGYYNLYGAN